MKTICLVFNNQVEPKIACGMDLYRLAIPYTPFKEVCEVVTISLNDFDFNPCEADVYVMNRPLEFRAKKVKDAGKILIVDVDDFWDLPTWHYLNPINLKKQLDFAEKNKDRVRMDEVNGVRQAYNRELTAKKNTLNSCKLADIVTCTTEILQNEFNKVGIKAVVVKNTILPQVEQFSEYKNPSSRVRFGWVGGAFHNRDVALMYDGMRRLHNDKTEQGKYQILASFNLNSHYIEGEKIMTNNYQCCSDEYRSYLKTYTKLSSHIGNDEAYKRLWNMSVTEYGAHYEQIDVALIPLQKGKFNSCKSELKLIEAGATGCAAIVSDVLPYNKWLKHGKNCLLVDGTSQWYTAMKILINNPDLRKELQYNLKKTIQENFDTLKESNILATELNKLIQ